MSKAALPLLKGLCYHTDMQKETEKFSISSAHKWSGIDLSTPIEQIECNCRGDLQNVAMAILPVSDNTRPIVVYNSCNRTLWAAMRRQLRQVPKPDKVCMAEFQDFCKDYFLSTVLPKLEDFDYNYNEWFNHLDATKQMELLPYMDGSKTDLTNLTYKLFCKREKQIIDGTMPKNRAIASCPVSMKYVMGPVVWALETYFKKIHGYKQSSRDGISATNWGEIEELYTKRWRDGLHHVIQGDGSAWDTSVTHDLRYLPNLIYSWLADAGFIHHVDPDIFKEVATARYRKLQANYFEDGRIKTLGTATLDSTTLSGSPDTTFANTLMMMMIQKFCMHKAGYTCDEYEHDTAGDDFAIMVPHISETLQQVYGKYWAPADSKATNHGLGVILKFLNVGDYGSLDYCSTNVIQDGETFKIVRQINRLNPLNHWSTKVLSYSLGQRKQYLLDLAMSVDSWAKGLPLYGDYSTYFRYYANLIDSEVKPTNTGRSKIVLTIDPKKGRPINGHSLSYSHYGRDFSYGLDLRQSKTLIDRRVVLNFLMDKYGLMEADLDLYTQRIQSGLMIYDVLNG